MNITDYFLDVINTDTNPYLLISQQVYKENGQLKSITNKKEIKLHNSNDQNFFVDLFNIVKDSNDIQLIDFYPKNIIQKIFSRKNINNLIEIDTLLDTNYIITSDSIRKMLKTECEIISQTNIDFKNIIIIANRNSTLYLKEKANEFEFSVNNQDFKIYKLT